MQRDKHGAYIEDNVSASDVRPVSPNYNMLPEIKGKVKNIKQLLMKDLEADGVVDRSVPHSHRRGVSKASITPLQYSYQPSMSSIKTERSYLSRISPSLKKTEKPSVASIAKKQQESLVVAHTSPEADQRFKKYW